MKFPTDCIKLSRSFGGTVILLQPSGVVQFSLRKCPRYRILACIGCFGLVLFASESAWASDFRAASAFALTKRSVSFGQRPSGSANIGKLRDWIVSELKGTGGELSTDPFQGQTPSGPIPMTNLILKFAGTSGKMIAVTGHYDTKN